MTNEWEVKGGRPTPCPALCSLRARPGRAHSPIHLLDPPWGLTKTSSALRPVRVLGGEALGRGGAPHGAPRSPHTALRQGVSSVQDSSPPSPAKTAHWAEGRRGAEGSEGQRVHRHSSPWTGQATTGTLCSPYREGCSSLQERWGKLDGGTSGFCFAF